MTHATVKGKSRRSPARSGKGPAVGMLVGGALAISCFATTARAEEPAPIDLPTSADDGAKHAIDRTWLYLDDARVAAPGAAVAMTSASYTSVGSNPGRIYAPYKAFAFNTAQPGALLSLGGEVGLLPRISIMALGQMGAGGEASNPSAGAIAGLRFQLSPPTWQSVHLVGSLGYLREAWTPDQPNGDNGAWVEAALSADFNRLRLGTAVHGEHVFADGRDGVDVMVKAGASYRVAGAFRAGVEWIGQDLEETVNDAREGGARQFVGPTASVQLLRDRLTVVAGPSIGLSERSPKLLGRLALAYGF
jgi:hypothetical protein